MKRLTIILAATLWVITIACTQDDPERSGLRVRSIGIQIHYQDTYVDERIPDHLALSGFSELLLNPEFSIKLKLGWWQTNKSLPGETFKYKGSTYIAQRTQVWGNWGLSAILRRQISSISTAGIGLGVDFIRVKRISYRSPAFWVDYLTDAVYLIESSIVDETETLVKPSVCIASDIEWELASRFLLVAELEYKLSFVGEKYGYTPLNTQNAYGVSVGLKYRFD